MTVKATYPAYDRLSMLCRRLGLTARGKVVESLDDWHEERVMLFDQETEAAGPAFLKVAHGTSVFLSSIKEPGKQPVFPLTEYKQGSINGIQDRYAVIADRDGPILISLSYAPEKASGVKERR